MTEYCVGTSSCPYYPECADTDHCLLDEEAKEILKEEDE